MIYNPRRKKEFIINEEKNVIILTKPVFNYVIKITRNSICERPPE